ncbi:MAG: uroporphyrinogen-III C-methyltransferase [Desulfobulbaceae bacterium DB1]|nr:MAG: uroporphyrinogen-III C-methyltransferase [Desulfobulbaceae bacterium DB1]
MGKKLTDTATKNRGKAYLVGAGPGDPGLITVRGLEILKKAEVVIYDYLAGEKLLKHVPADAEFIYAGKQGGIKHTHTQDEINQLLVDRVRSGKKVVRLKGGDPFIFGRGGEELEELVKAGLSFEAVPGVTSASAAATFAGVPITHRRFTSSVAFITGHEDPNKENSNIAWDKISTGVGTLVFYMGIKNLESIAENLMKNGRDPKTPVAVVRWASRPNQKSVVGTLDNIAEIVREKGIKPPALTIVGDVVNLRDTINWYEVRPLFGKRIIVTRTREQASELVSLLEENGANCLEFPTISICPPDSWDALDEALQQLGRFQWLVFTSINAIHAFFGRLYEKGMDTRALASCKIAAVGKVTDDCLRTYGLISDLLPEDFTGEGLAEAFERQGVAGNEILIPRALKAREVLPERLERAGARVTIVPVYQNKRPEGIHEKLRAKLENKDADIVTFTSSSTVTNFIHMLGVKDQDELQRIMGGIKIAAIGPVTAKTVEANGLKVDIQPETYTIPDLVDAIVKDAVVQA